jgi:hypothetical protein
MDTTTKIKKGCFAALIFATILLAISTPYFIGVHLSKESTTNSNAAELIADYVVDMPDCALRSNLLTVFGAEYNDSSEELNEVLRAYAKMKVKELNSQL